MILNASMKKILAARGYSHHRDDEEFTRHGDHARNIQYAYSKEFEGHNHRVVDLIFLGVDLVAERLVITLFRENVSIENGVLVHSDISLPLKKYSLEEFEKKLDKLIPKGNPLKEERMDGTQF